MVLCHCQKHSLKMKYFFIIVFQVVWTSIICAQNISGQIKDEETQEPVAFVEIYIHELKILENTDEQGKFSFSNLPQGKFVMQFSRIGYETFFFELNTQDSTSFFRIKMKVAIEELKEVKIIGTQIQSPKNTSFSIDAISKKEMTENGSLSISDGVAKLPGVSQISTGAGISKPVIRGLYGNRIQVNTMGIKFDNQQWQDEHGLGLSDMGISRVEVIKGPATLMYGSEALGGVINVIEEKPAAQNKSEQELNIKLLSNTYGIGADYGYKKSINNHWKRLRIGIENNGDYSSAQNYRVLNSRFANYNLKYSSGFQKNNWSSTNNFYASFSQFGFVFDSISYKELDSRISRTYDGPHHRVLFGMYTSENTLFLKNHKIKINGGLITNNRQEQEGGNKISLNMLLNTASVLAQITTPLAHQLEWTNGVSLMFQSNNNFGARIIIPDAFLGEEAIFTYLKQKQKRWIWESGLRLDLKQIKTLTTENLNAPGEDVEAFGKEFTAFNGCAGFSYFLSEELTFKSNAGSGYRPGNLAELSSNGLHEGTSRWEIGNPNLKVEQNINSECSLIWDNEKSIEFSISTFYNRFYNYIYLAPTGKEYYGFNIYNYVQSNAVLKGGEASIDIHPKNAKWLDFNVNYAYIEARKEDGSFLPFIPANRLNSSLKFILKDGKKWKNTFVKISNNLVFAQSNAAEFESTTPSYSLFNLAIGSHLQLKNKLINFNLVVSNICDEKYVDHLSRLKYYGFYNMGRNIQLNMNLPF